MKKINIGGIREYKGLSNKDKFIADQLYYVISLKSILEKKNTIKNSLLPNINEYNLDEMTKKITKGNLEYALQQKSISDINKVLKTSINALIEEKEYANGGGITKKPTQSQLDKMTAFNLMDAMKNDKKNYQLYKKQLLKLYPDAKGFSNGGGVGEIGDNFRGKLNNDIKYVFVSDTFGSYLGNIPKIELFKDWESAKKSYIKYLKTSNNYMGNWTMALYECNGDCSIYSQGNVKKVKNAKQLNRFYGHHQYVEGKIIDSVKVDNKKFTINLIEEKEYANGGNMQGFCYTIGGL